MWSIPFNVHFSFAQQILFLVFEPVFETLVARHLGLRPTHLAWADCCEGKGSGSSSSAPHHSLRERELCTAKSSATRQGAWRHLTAPLCTPQSNGVGGVSFVCTLQPRVRGQWAIYLLQLHLVDCFCTKSKWSVHAKPNQSGPCMQRRELRYSSSIC